MIRSEVAQLLTVASGFDRRVVDELTVNAWFTVPEIAGGYYADAVAVVVAHQTGPKRYEYLTVGHVVEGMRGMRRQNAAQVESDVRSAKARGIVPKSWPKREPLSDEAMERLAAARQVEQDEVRELTSD